MKTWSPFFHIEEGNGFRRQNESRGSHDVGSSDKSIADQRSTPHTPLSKTSKYYHLKSLEGSKNITVVMIEKVPLRAVVHGRPKLHYEVKVSVIKVLPDMHNEPLWLRIQGGEDTIGGTEGRYLVGPEHLVKYLGDVIN